jgi:hypothetical protein
MNIFILPVIEGNGSALRPCRSQELYCACTITEGGGDTGPGIRMLAEEVRIRECREGCVQPLGF